MTGDSMIPRLLIIETKSKQIVLALDLTWDVEVQNMLH